MAILQMFLYPVCQYCRVVLGCKAESLQATSIDGVDHHRCPVGQIRETTQVVENVRVVSILGPEDPNSIRQQDNRFAAGQLFKTTYDEVNGPKSTYGEQVFAILIQLLTQFAPADSRTSWETTASLFQRFCFDR